MCGRYSLTTEPEALRQLFNFKNLPNFPPRYNVAPTQSMPVVRQGEGGRELVVMRWGLVPWWAKEASIGASCINARADSVATKAAFRDAYKSRRCLVPADGFYEWRTEGGERQPYLIRAPGGKPFAFAGLWERWIAKVGTSQKAKPPAATLFDAGGPPPVAPISAGDTIETYTIVTTVANAKLSSLHERMPVILAPADYDAWLDVSKSEQLLRPSPDNVTEFFQVSRRVNSVRYDDPECMVPLAA